MIMSILSQDLRSQMPVELRIFLDNDGHDICIQSSILNQKYNRIRLPKPLTEDDLPAIKRILAFLTRDELLHDLENQVEERTAELKKERAALDELEHRASEQSVPREWRRWARRARSPA